MWAGVVQVTGGMVQPSYITAQQQQVAVNHKLLNVSCCTYVWRGLVKMAVGWIRQCVQHTEGWWLGNRKKLSLQFWQWQSVKPRRCVEYRWLTKGWRKNSRTQSVSCWLCLGQGSGEKKCLWCQWRDSWHSGRYPGRRRTVTSCSRWKVASRGR